MSSYIEGHWVENILYLTVDTPLPTQPNSNDTSPLERVALTCINGSRPSGLIVDISHLSTIPETLNGEIVELSNQLNLVVKQDDAHTLAVCLIDTDMVISPAAMASYRNTSFPIYNSPSEAITYLHSLTAAVPLPSSTADGPPNNNLISLTERASSFIATQNPYLLAALIICLAYHATLSFYTYNRTYDAFVHIFFGDHYARSWFDPWDSRWYTGFTLTSYPPGSQQTIGLLSFVIPLNYAFVVAQTLAMLNCTIGIYRFSKIWVSEEAAGYAALLFVFSSSITETVHVFGQLPTTFSLGFLLNAVPFAYRWMSKGEWHILIAAWIMNAATTAGHHVTTLFGAVFFVAPVMGLAILEKFREEWTDEPPYHPEKITRKNLKPLMVRRLRRIVPVTLRTGLYGVGMIAVLLIVVLPYWLWSASDPITQISIPHASRDSFIENTAAGLVFWLVPYGLSLFILPYVVYKGFTTKAWPVMLSWCLLFFLGTGGTTPFPRMLLGGAFDILTLDRFTFWATIILLPFAGEFVRSIRHGRFARYLVDQFGPTTWRTLQFGLIFGYVITSIFVANLTQFRKFQPATIDINPIVSFMEKDEHWRWRYMTLGFGDQVAWLSAHMDANMIDGNYHSARRLPELTTTPVERLEGAKYSGIPGIGSLQQFLAVPDKYNLKFIFSNDQFYDPLLYFSGWHRLQRLENGIMVWEKGDIPPLPEILPRKDIPTYQKMMWGIVPMTALALGVLVMSSPFWQPPAARLYHFLGIPKAITWLDHRLTPRLSVTPRSLYWRIWHWLDAKLIRWSTFYEEDTSPVTRWQIWYDWFAALPKPKPAAPSAKVVRSVLLFAIAAITAAYTLYTYRSQLRDPIHIVEAYYDDLDFRRFQEAYARLDPQSRPSYEQYLLELSVVNGLVASYGKLDAIEVELIEQEPERVVVSAKSTLITALNYYVTTQEHVLVLRDDEWKIIPEAADVTIPPDQFFRKSAVEWHAAGRRRITTESTSFGDILDRPELQILSARLVWVNGRYSVVGELINTDADPADITVAAFIYDENGEELVWYNAQQALMHKIFPKEVTPFRIDFEGVAGLNIAGLPAPVIFEPNAFYPIEVDNPPVRFEVYGRALVTTYDLFRDVAAQNLTIAQAADGTFTLHGELYNSGIQEATIPHVMVTYYDEQNRVVWVDDFYIEEAVRPQRTQPFQLPLTPASEVETLIDNGDAYANTLQDEVNLNDIWLERLPAPEELGYTSMRVSINYFVGIVQ